MSRHRYPIEACRVFERTEFTKLKGALTCCKTSDGDESSEAIANENPSDKPKELNDAKKNDVPILNKKGTNGKKSGKATLKTILGETLSYGPALAEHIILDAGLLPNMKVRDDADNKIDEGMILALEQAITRFDDWLTDILFGQKVPEGYILMQNKSNEKKGLVSLQESTADKVDLKFQF